MHVQVNIFILVNFLQCHPVYKKWHNDMKYAVIEYKIQYWLLKLIWEEINGFHLT